MANLGFDIYAQRISGAGNLWMDAIILVPSKHYSGFTDVEVCESSYDIDDSGNKAYADLDIRMSPADEPVVIADSSDFLGVDVGITESIIQWEIPNEDCMFVAFFETDNGHVIADDCDVTVKMYPRYDTRNTD